MSLLYRIAISNGNKSRKIKAHQVITAMEQHKVSRWNKSLKAEIRRKRLKYMPLLNKS